MTVNPEYLPPLLQLLLDLALPENSSLLGRFRASPGDVMDKYGLTPGEQNLVLSGDLARIREAIDSAFFASGKQPPSGDETYALVVTWAPPPPPPPKTIRRDIGVWG